YTPPPPPPAQYPPPPAAAPAVWQPPPRPPEAVPAAMPVASGPTVTSLVSGNSLHPAGGFYVQTGSFSTAENAERQREAVRSYGVSEISQGSAGGRDVYRVRLGPYTTPDAAGIVADRLKRSGYGDARVVSN